MQETPDGDSDSIIKRTKALLDSLSRQD